MKVKNQQKNVKVMLTDKHKTKEKKEKQQIVKSGVKSKRKTRIYFITNNNSNKSIYLLT